MRKINQNIDYVKQKIASMIGVDLDFVINRGRNKLENYQGQIISAFPSIFTINLLIGEDEQRLEAFSYNDILTRAIKINHKKQKTKISKL